MKPVRLTFLMMMLLLAANVAAQEEFFDDVYFSSKSKKNKVQQVESKKVEQPKLQSSYQVLPAERSEESQEATSVNGRDVDEYNRRYSGVEVEELEGDRLRVHVRLDWNGEALSTSVTV